MLYTTFMYGDRMEERSLVYGVTFHFLERSSQLAVRFLMSRWLFAVSISEILKNAGIKLQNKWIGCIQKIRQIPSNPSYAVRSIKFDEDPCSKGV